MTRGYFRDIEATAEARRYGWHRTGDLGYFDSDGYLCIIDRLTEVIISGGLNIYARQLEEIILNGAEIAECTVVGVPDNRWGESVKTPKRIEFGDTLPKTTIEKVYNKATGACVWRSLE